MYLERAPTVEELVEKLDTEELLATLRERMEIPARYLHWDKLRRLEPPAGLSSEQWWLKLKGVREGDLRPLPLTDPDDAPFRYGVLDSMLRQLHYIDQRCSGEVGMDEVVTSERQAGRRFLVNSLMEEAIRSK